MNRTRRLAALSVLIAPALALTPALTAHAASTSAPRAASAGMCHVERESNGTYHLWGMGFASRARVSYSGSSSGTVATDHAGRFDVDGLSGSRFVVRTPNGKASLTCGMVNH
ncbi:hypothetical protein [Streptomyces tropicalis]|uniref:Secreted protein n=1 Tax=Streptomyces tropicalis TaxID=3034234 RepID=A0ABT6AEK9_9ACTN|nr:hypothetical protein [Streptomyces tropicalis]MDF3303086.1 hypothetical protein [Streptomyces tropicalis]